MRHRLKKQYNLFRSTKYSFKVIFMVSESQQHVSARRSSQVRVIPLPRSAPKVGAVKATRQCRAVVAPTGQDEKRPSASLIGLEVGWLLRRTIALHLAASRLAEFTNITLKEY